MPNFRVGDPPPRHYSPDQLGGLCPACGTPVPAALAGAGILEHPCCDPDFTPLRAASRRAEKKALPKPDTA